MEEYNSTLEVSAMEKSEDDVPLEEIPIEDEKEDGMPLWQEQLPAKEQVPKSRAT